MVSRVNLGDGRETKNPAEAYYDEDGNYHFHQSVSMIWPWTCSRGHSGSAIVTKPCDSAGIKPNHAPAPCGFVGSTVIKVNE